MKNFDVKGFKSGETFSLTLDSDIRRKKAKFDSEQIFLEDDEFGNLYIMSLGVQTQDPQLKVL